MYRSKLAIQKWKFIFLVPFVLLIATYFYFISPIPTICSLPEGENLIILSGRKFQTPLRPIDSLFILDPDTGTVWQWGCSQVTQRDVAWVSQQKMLSLFTEDGMLTIYQLLPNGTFSQIQPVSDVYGKHSWASDGEKIVYTSPESPGANTELYILNISNAEVSRLTFLKTDENSPNWAPNGKEIVFESYDQDAQTFSLYKINQDGSGLTHLTEQISGNNRLPKWSPDGTKIAFLHTTVAEEAPSIWVIDADGGELSTVFNAPSNEHNAFIGGVRNFAWSPDSKQLVFASGHEGPCKAISLDAKTVSCNEHIYIINIENSDLIKLNNRPLYRHYDLMWIR